MGFVVKLIITAVAAMLGAYLLPGVHIGGIGSALILALVLAVLNFIVRPILVLFTIPVTLLTLGLFLLVINAVIILLASYIMGSGFSVDNFWWALLISILLSIITAILDAIFGPAD